MRRDIDRYAAFRVRRLGKQILDDRLQIDRYRIVLDDPEPLFDCGIQTTGLTVATATVSDRAAFGQLVEICRAALFLLVATQRAFEAVEKTLRRHRLSQQQETRKTCHKKVPHH